MTSLDWNAYRTMRFGDHPAVTAIVVQQLHEKSSGAGEEVLPAVVAAIGKAFFDATGVRLRRVSADATACVGRPESVTARLLIDCVDKDGRLGPYRAHQRGGWAEPARRRGTRRLETCHRAPEARLRRQRPASAGRCRWTTR